MKPKSNLDEKTRLAERGAWAQWYLEWDIVAYAIFCGPFEGKAKEPKRQLPYRQPSRQDTKPTVGYVDDWTLF
ncbi:MAG: hypothetical protein KJ955_03165 [Nanoarchaeota archaeon]|nr:hypothetical protein [Nanoarchaeota archaeon]